LLGEGKKERNRCITESLWKGEDHVDPKQESFVITNIESQNSIQITGIDRTNNTVFLSVNGCRVTAVFRDLNNREVYQRLKEMLIDSMIIRASVASLT
jgi:hypothetical protein